MFKLTISLIQFQDQPDDWRAEVKLTVFDDSPKERTAVYFGKTRKQAFARAISWVNAMVYDKGTDDKGENDTKSTGGKGGA